MIDLCSGKGGLQLAEMSKLYLEELAIASSAAKGEYEAAAGAGDHVGTQS
jgi:fructose-bisphosphate aldolase class I